MDGNIIFITLAAILALPIFFIPSIIAYRRKHAYLGVIVGLNIFGFTGFLWIIAFIWAVFPSNKSLIDPFLGNVTGTGVRNTGDTIGSVKYGVRRGEEQERKTDHDANPPLAVNDESVLADSLARIEKLYGEKIINDEEYARMRGGILEKYESR
jgi:Superinfection immunity protein